MDHIWGSVMDVPVYRWEQQWPSYPSTLEDFRSFPARCNWMVTQQYELRPMKGGSGTFVSMSYANFLQRWLIFGLLATVLRDEEGGRVKISKFIKNGHIVLNSLDSTLQAWDRFEKANQRGATGRLMEAEAVLEYARHVVKQNLAAKPLPKTASPEPPLRSQFPDGTEIPEDVLAEFYGHTSEMSQEKHERMRGDNKLSLFIMILGETLSGQKSKIMADLNINIRGWNSAGEEEDAGWGPPNYVLDKMKTQEWCPRTVQILLGQLGSSATLLLSSLHHHKKSKYHLRHGCDYTRCKVISGSNNGVAYKHAHLGKDLCAGESSCREVSIDKSKLYTILESVDTNSRNEGVAFPVFRAWQSTSEDTGSASNKTWNIEVKSWNDGKPSFATISHVWSDGLGNETRNGVHPCQLKFINRLLQKASRDQQETLEEEISERWFWLDTLGIPVRDRPDAESSSRDPERHRKAGETHEEILSQEDFKKLKKTAIHQIHAIFEKASYAIVIDGSLSTEDAGSDFATKALRVLTSNWMRRLWTLQEAYLSRRLFIAFNHDPEILTGLDNFDDIMSKLTDENQEDMEIILAISQLIHRKVFHNIMGTDRAKRIHSGEIPPRGSLLIANAWRAVRWRIHQNLKSTSKQEDETLALATLLQLDYRSSIISSAGVDEASQEDRDKMMQEFWKILDKHYAGSIPPGIIFLPGEKLNLHGFRWAPRTWMSSHVEDYPHPLGIVNRPTTLADTGLIVRYPGFMLHCRHDARSNTALVIGKNISNTRRFDFPIDLEFQQWYRAEVADGDVHKTTRHQGFLKMILEKDKKDPLQLAIIISRPNLRGMVPEIGLLVHIHESISRKDEHDSRGKEVIERYCKIIQRVRVSMLGGFVGSDEEATDSAKRGRARTSEDANCYGEMLGPEQVWIVDGSDYNEFQDGKNNTGTRGDVTELDIADQVRAATKVQQQQKNSGIFSRLFSRSIEKPSAK